MFDENLETVKQIRAYVRRLPCTCSKGKGLTHKARRFCNRCQAQLLLKDLRQRMEQKLA